MWLTLFFACITAIFLFMTVGSLFHSHWCRRLPAFNDADSSLQSDRARCSVVIAARDEELRIEATIRRLLEQQGVSIEVIVVNDRSVDGTGDIVGRMAEDDNRIRTLRVQELPSGWLGKCHACHLGASDAKGEWILFTDADCWLKPDVISRALCVADREGADHIALTPGVAAETIGARAVHIAFLLTVANWMSGVNRDRPKAYLGMGAFNLMRASAYRECGGYEALRLTVLDDVKLGLLLRRAGKRTRAFIGGDDVECHWGTTVRGMIRVMEKNYFAAVDYRTATAITAGCSGILLWGVALVGPFTGTVTGITAGLAVLSLAGPSFVFARRLRWSWYSAILAPLALPVLFYSMLNSVSATVRQRGVLWRDTFYPLETLRAGTVR